MMHSGGQISSRQTIRSCESLFFVDVCCRYVEHLKQLYADNGEAPKADEKWGGK